MYPLGQDGVIDPMRLCFRLFVAVHILVFATQNCMAKAVKVCSSGSIVMGSFTDHVAELRKSGRYTAEDIDDLVKKERQGGPGFFSSQIVIKEEQSGSGTFDLQLFQGFSDPKAKYRSIKAWACDGDDYPIAYFVGFRVRAIRHGVIYVSRDKGVVNLISLKHVDPDLDKHTPVKEFHGNSVLCQDIGAACIDTIFRGRW
jgi:hypothetical protein